MSVPDAPRATPGATPPGDPPPGRTLRLDLQFDGTAFEGWQRQANGRTVQGVVERALARILGRPHAVLGCGRTDAGVHAEQMIVSLRTDHTMPARELARALDAVLPEDVGVLAARDAPATFHARRDALWKWYRYRILVARHKCPLRRRRTWRHARVPPLAALQAAAAPLEGRHDFASFANAGSSPGRTTVRTLHHLRWTVAGDELHLDAVGDGFLYKMVRTLVGTLLDAAGAPDPADAVRAILAARRREAAGRAAPAVGLTLMAVAVRGEAPPGTVPESLQPFVDCEHRADPTSPAGGTS